MPPARDTEGRDDPADAGGAARRARRRDGGRDRASGRDRRHAEAVQAAIESMDGTVAMARALVEGGRRVDLAGLERDAAALCAAVLTLDGSEARRLRPALEALLRQVDGLAGRLASP